MYICPICIPLLPPPYKRLNTFYPQEEVEQALSDAAVEVDGVIEEGVDGVVASLGQDGETEALASAEGMFDSLSLPQTRVNPSYNPVGNCTS